VQLKAWRVRETKGAIGFIAQRELLIQVAALLPEGTAVVLMGDRFYGSPELIALCRSPYIGDPLLAHRDQRRSDPSDFAADGSLLSPAISFDSI